MKEVYFLFFHTGGEWDNFVFFEWPFFFGRGRRVCGAGGKYPRSGEGFFFCVRPIILFFLFLSFFVFLFLFFLHREKQSIAQVRKLISIKCFVKFVNTQLVQISSSGRWVRRRDYSLLFIFFFI